MHDVLTLLYCCAANESYPTKREWISQIQYMCDILLPSDRPCFEYHNDPFVVVSFFHSVFEPSTFDLDLVVEGFMSGTSDVSTSVWGPPAWNLLHTMARDDERYTEIHSLLKWWEHLLPCPVCRKHLTSHLENTTFDHKTPQQAYDYTVLLHNAVNTQLDKPAHIQ